MKPMKNNGSSVHHLCPTPFGDAAILFQQKPFLIKGLLLPEARPRAMKKHLAGLGAAEAGSTSVVLALCRRLQDYFQGSPICTPWEHLDLSGLTALAKAVLRAV